MYLHVFNFPSYSGGFFSVRTSHNFLQERNEVLKTILRIARKGQKKGVEVNIVHDNKAEFIVEKDPDAMTYIKEAISESKNTKIKGYTPIYKLFDDNYDNLNLEYCVYEFGPTKSFNSLLFSGLLVKTYSPHVALYFNGISVRKTTGLQFSMMYLPNDKVNDFIRRMRTGADSFMLFTLSGGIMVDYQREVIDPTTYRHNHFKKTLPYPAMYKFSSFESIDNFINTTLKSIVKDESSTEESEQSVTKDTQEDVPDYIPF